MTCPNAAVVSQRLCNLLLSFPEAAIAGVEWQALARKYEERHAQQLDLQALGHSSALAAASTLLWDVLRVANSDDTDNPIVALEDHVALTAQPGLLGCWPSLYKALCEVALEHGSAESGATAKGLLMSQLKPLLEKQWHTSFEENGLGYLTAKGSFVKLKKMKHLVQAVISWRRQRVAWRLEDAAARTEVDEALAPSLELEASSRHNDLVLRCTPAGPWDLKKPVLAPAGAPAAPGPPQQQARVPVAGVAQCQSPVAGRSCRPSQSCCTGGEVSRQPCRQRSAGAEVGALEQEVALLRAENAALRGELQVRASTPQPLLRCGSLSEAPPQHDVLGFDDPFEPPPEAGRWQGYYPWGAASSPAPSCSTSCGGGRDLAWESASSVCGGGSDFGEYTDTPRSSRRSLWDFPPSTVPSGAVTPQESPAGAEEARAAFLPVATLWAMVPPTARGALHIPCGIVQSMRAHFEQGAGAQ